MYNDTPLAPASFLQTQLNIYGISVRECASRIHEHPHRLYAILDNSEAITVPLALKLGKLFRLEPATIMQVQMQWDLYRYTCLHINQLDQISSMGA